MELVLTSIKYNITRNGRNIYCEKKIFFLVQCSYPLQRDVDILLEGTRLLLRISKGSSSLCPHCVIVSINYKNLERNPAGQIKKQLNTCPSSNIQSSLKSSLVDQQRSARRLTIMPDHWTNLKSAL